MTKKFKHKKTGEITTYKDGVSAESLILKKVNYPKLMDDETCVPVYEVKQLMIEFAKLHCEAQLKTILENVKIKGKKKSQFGKSRKWQNIKENEEVDLFSYEVQYLVGKDSIINAYPLDKIK